MTFAEVVEISNLIAVLALPGFTALIGHLHRTNRDRWDNVNKALKRAKKEHQSLDQRLRRIEQQIEKRGYTWGDRNGHQATAEANR